MALAAVVMLYLIMCVVRVILGGLTFDFHMGDSGL